MRKLLLIAAVLTFGSPLNAMTSESKEKCERLVSTLFHMAVGGAPLEVMYSHIIIPTNSLKDGYNEAVNEGMIKSILVYVYYRIGQGILADELIQKRTFLHMERSRNDFCDPGGRGDLYFK